MEVRTNFTKTFKLWKACSNDDARPVMEYVYFKDGYAYASDSHILVRVPLEECSTFDDESRALLDGCLIRGSVLKYIVGLGSVLVKKTDDGVVYLETEIGENTIKIYLAKNGDILKYPNAEAILQSKAENATTQKIGFNSKFIACLKDALGTDVLKFEITDEKHPVFVSPANLPSNGIGVIIPYITD